MFSIANHLKWGLILLASAILLATLSKWSANSTTFIVSDKQLRSLVEDAARYSSDSERDTNKVKRLTNSSYAMAYLEAVRKMCSDSDIEKATGINLNELISSVRYRHRSALRGKKNI